jgi:hypothetical protein
MLGLVSAALLVAVAPPAPAPAQSDPFLEAGDGNAVKGGAVQGTGQESLGRNTRVRRTPATVGRTRSAPRERRVRAGRRCARIGSTRTCTSYRARRPHRICIKQGKGRERCRAARLARPRALPRTVSNQGFLTRNIAQVGKIWLNALPHCSGTLIERGIIITAAHCIYDNGLTGGSSGYYHERVPLEFTPNSTWNGATAIELYPGDGAVATLYAPNHVWRIVNAWVPQCWAENNGQCDVAFAELEPARDGSYVGDVLGWWRVVTHLTIPIGARYFVVGYPGSGAFASGGMGYGNLQYFCDTRWQGEFWNHSTLSAGVNNISSEGCGMTGGASGGPDFIALSDGTWAVNGVNSAGTSNTQTGFGVNISWNYAGDVTAGLYCYVLPCGRSARARASRSSAMSRPIAGSRGTAAPAAYGASG